MYHIAVVEDEKICSMQLQDFLEQYQKEKNIRFKVSVFYDGAELLADYQPVYDLILLDIEMPGSTGMEIAENRKLLTIDEQLVYRKIQAITERLGITR